MKTISMPKSKLSYFEQEDILHLVISEEARPNSLELSPTITAELNEREELIGIEILNASTFVEGAQVKLFQLIPPAINFKLTGTLSFL